MKKLLKVMAVAALAFTVSGIAANAQGLKDVIGSVKGVVEDLTASKDFKISDLAGTWNYSAPAVAMKGDNALKNIGGSAAATQIEGKLEPFYKKAGLDNLVIEIGADSTFSMNIKKVSLKGTISKDDEGLVFTFDKLQSHPVRCIATKSGSKLNLTFDATKLINVLETATKVINISSLKAITSLLKSYDGLYMGFQLTKSAEADGSKASTNPLDALFGS